MTLRWVRRWFEILGIAMFGILVGVLGVSTILRHSSDSSDRVTQERAVPGPTIDRSRVRVEVRNGSGTSGAAGEMTTFLREQGFDVVDFGNADRFDYSDTRVIDRVGAPVAAQEVADVVGAATFETEIDSTLYLDVTVIVGRAQVADTAHPDIEGRTWWDRFLDL